MRLISRVDDFSFNTVVKLLADAGATRAAYGIGSAALGIALSAPTKLA